MLYLMLFCTRYDDGEGYFGDKQKRSHMQLKHAKKMLGKG